MEKSIPKIWAVSVIVKSCPMKGIAQQAKNRPNLVTLTPIQFISSNCRAIEP
jgi:hypothetical protein